jgi:hypothetical protein
MGRSLKCFVKVGQLVHIPPWNVPFVVLMAFVPIAYTMARYIDARYAWANGRNPVIGENFEGRV